MTRRGVCQALHWTQFALLLGLISTQSPSAPWVMAYGIVALAWSGLALTTGLVGRPGPKLDALARHVHQWGHRVLYLLVGASGALALMWLSAPEIRLQYWLFLLFMLSLLHGMFHLWRHTALNDRALCMILPKVFHGIL